MKLRRAISMKVWERAARGFAGPLRRGPVGAPATWSKAIPLGDHVQLRASKGFRAASFELKPGLWIVAELRADAFELGATARQVTDDVLRTVDRTLDTLFPARARNKEQWAEQVRQRAEVDRRERELRARESAMRAVPPAQPAGPAPVAQDRALPRGAASWLDDEDDLGCSGRACDCGGRR